MNNTKHLFDAMQEARIAANAKTTAERQRAFKAAKAAAGLTEVRGIFAPQERHADIRAAASKMLKPKQPIVQKVSE